MKSLNVRVVIIVVSVFLTLNSSAQEELKSNSGYYYSQVTIHYGGYYKFKTSEITFGSTYKSEVENEVQIQSAIASLNNPVDIMNYLDGLGWELVQNQNMLFNDMVVVYTFRKEKDN